MARRSSNCRLLSGLCSMLKTPGGDREMVEILAEQAVLAAVELALRLAPPTKTHILNVLHRLVDGKPIDPPAVKPPSALTLTAEPQVFRNSFPNGANGQTTCLNNFEKEKSVRLGACDRPFPLSNEIQRASIPTRLRYPNCGIRTRGLWASHRAEHGLSQQPFDRPLSDEERRSQ
jgi:hypothetical protein